MSATPQFPGIDFQNPKSVYLFTGEVDTRRTSAVEALVSKLVDPEYQIFDLEHFDGETASAEAVLGSAATLPIGSERKVVVVDRVDRLTSGDQDSIAFFIKRLSEAQCTGWCCLILLSGNENPLKRKKGASQSSGTAPISRARGGEQGEIDGSQETGSDRPVRGLKPTLVAAVKKTGAVITFGKLRSRQMDMLIRESVKANDKKIDAPAVNMLTQSIFAVPSTLDREIEKLVAYIGDRDTITIQDVDRVATKSPEDRIFPLIDALAIGKSDEAIHLLSETFAATPKPDNEVMRILYMIARHFRMLYQVKYLMTNGCQRSLRNVPDALRSMLMKEQPFLSTTEWQQGKLISQAAQFTFAEIESALRAILRCELIVKGQKKGATSPRLNLETLIIRLSHRPSRSHSKP